MGGFPKIFRLLLGLCYVPGQRRKGSSTALMAGMNASMCAKLPLTLPAKATCWVFGHYFDILIHLFRLLKGSSQHFVRIGSYLLDSFSSDTHLFPCPNNTTQDILQCLSTSCWRSGQHGGLRNRVAVRALDCTTTPHPPLSLPRSRTMSLVAYCAFQPSISN